MDAPATTFPLRLAIRVDESWEFEKSLPRAEVVIEAGNVGEPVVLFSHRPDSAEVALDGPHPADAVPRGRQLASARIVLARFASALSRLVEAEVEGQIPRRYYEDD